jgi:hypothetical protein
MPTANSAKFEAERRGLKPKEWTYVPFENVDVRTKLRGLRVYREQLIGVFSEIELNVIVKEKKDEPITKGT